MKILIVSDTHGDHRNLEKILDREKELDMLLHLGDVESDEYYIQEYVTCEVHMVAGNNDFWSDLPREKEIQIGKYYVYMTHGDAYYVSAHTRRLKQRGLEKNAMIVMYGHTHKPDIDLTDSIIAINPGSLSYPRQAGRQASYIIMNLDEKGDAKFTLKYV